MTEMMFDGMPDPIIPIPAEKLSVDRRRTMSQRARLAAGVHPATHLRLLEPAGQTCGDCVNHVEHSRNRTWHKCKIAGVTNGAGTDIRVRWPACVKFKKETA